MLRPNIQIKLLEKSVNNAVWPLSGSSMVIRLLKTSAAEYSQKETEARPISEMPGMKTFPIIGNMMSMISRKDFNVAKFHKFWLNISNDYGPITQVNFIGLPKMVLITNADDIEKLYRTTMDNPIREGFNSLKKIRKEDVDNYFESKGGLLVENNEEWWRVRSKVQTPMMRPKNVVKYLPQMDEVTLNFMDRIAELQTRHGEMPENFLKELYKWALESVGLVALNRRLGCLEPNISSNSVEMKMIENVSEIFESMNDTELSLPLWRIFPTPAYRRLKKAHSNFLKIVDEQIRQNEAALKSKLENQKEIEETNLMETLMNTEGLSRKDVVTMIIDMLFAGIDTTSHVIAFTLYLLSRNPEAQKRLQEEVDSVLGDGQGTLTEGQLARLSFTKTCVKESMRLFPVALGHLRKLEADTVLGGYLIPKGFQVHALTYATSRDESLFPRAEEYLPERWDRNRPLGPIHPFGSLPFSHGPRMCIGRRIAEQEIFTFLARVMHRYSVNYKYNDIEIVTKFVSTPSQPLRFEFQERRGS